jgi:nucleoside-triphosphatase
VHVLITGRPGIGKTTFVDELAGTLRERGIRLFGFVTREIRSGGTRVGFGVEQLWTGVSGTLARKGFESRDRVGSYGVDVEEFERVALPALVDEGAELLVIDEIGKMELFSRGFRERVKGLLRGERPPVLATVREQSIPILDEWDVRSRCELLTLTRGNTDELEGWIIRWIEGEMAR